MTAYFEPTALLKFLKSNKDFLMTTLGSEIAGALVLARVLSKEKNGEYLTGFIVKNKYAKEIGARIQVPNEEIGDYLTEIGETDTIVDFTIIAKKNVSEKNPVGNNFQVKRIGPGGMQVDNKYIIDYLNSKKISRYPSTNTFLLLILEPRGNPLIDFKVISDGIKGNQYPFLKILFSASTGPNTLLVGEIWPEPGMNEYTMSDFFDS